MDLQSAGRTYVGPPGRRGYNAGPCRYPPHLPPHRAPRQRRPAPPSHEPTPPLLPADGAAVRVGAHRLVPGPGDWAAGAQRAGVRGSAHDGAGEVEEEEDFLEEENGDFWTRGWKTTTTTTTRKRIIEALVWVYGI